MRRTRLLLFAVVGIFLLASPAIATAGDGDWGSPTDIFYGPGGSHPLMDGGTRAESPDLGAYESRETLEAGRLPYGEDTMGPGGESWSDESVPIVERGGVSFRFDIDNGP